MFRPRKRVTWRQRRLIRHLRRSKHGAVQDVTLHELHRSFRRSHGLKPPKAPDVSGHGTWRPLTRKARGLLSRLRSAREWNVKKNLIAELAREMEHGRRLAARIRLAAGRGARRARLAAGRASRRLEHAAEAAGRGARKTREQVRRASEAHLKRLEHRQDEREAGKRRAPLSTRVARNVRQRIRGARKQAASRWASRRRLPRRLPRRLARVPGRRRAVPARQAVPRPVRAARARAPRPARSPRPVRSGRPARVRAR